MGLPGRIQVSQTTYELLKEDYTFEAREAIQVKGKGEMLTYFLTGFCAESPSAEPPSAESPSAESPSAEPPVAALIRNPPKLNAIRLPL